MTRPCDDPAAQRVGVLLGRKPLRPGAASDAEGIGVSRGWPAEGATGKGQLGTAAQVVSRIAAVRDELSTLGALAVASADWSAADRQVVWLAIERLSGTLTTARSAWLVVDRDAGTAAALGDGSVAAAVDRRSGCGMRAAHDQVRQADALTAMPRVADAVGAGRVPVAHLDVVAKVLERSSRAVGEALTSTQGQATVVRLAEATDLRRFTRDLSAWVAALDPARLERDHQDQRRARFLHLSDTADGCYLKGRLDRFSGEVVRRALDRMGEAPDDDRTPEQARADALSAMASTVLGLPVSGSVATVRPHVSLVVDAPTFAAVRTELGRRSGRACETAHDGSTDAGTRPLTCADVRSIAPETGSCAPACTEDGVPVPFSELTRVLCDADVSRVVLEADSTPVDLGRSVRLFSGAVRRAVIVRDQVCAFGGCGKPARWGEVHHIDWWDRDGGGTSVQNGVLLCVFHHHEVHRADLRIRRVPADPLGVLPGVRPRPRYEFRTPDGRFVTAAGERTAGSPAPADVAASRPPGPSAAPPGRSSDLECVPPGGLLFGEGPPPF